MKSSSESPSKFWRPQQVWIAKKNYGVCNPGQQSLVGESRSLASSLISEISKKTGGELMAKKGGMRNAPSKTGRPSGKGRSNR